MKEIIFGTTNEAKIKQVRGVLPPAGISVEGIPNKEILPEIPEDGKTALENAHKKAVAYANALGKTVFSMDNALYLDGLKDEEQPGLNVRRMSGSSERLNDEQMIEYYSRLISRLEGRVNGYWEFGICIANPDGEYRQTVIRSPRIFVASPCPQMQPGYPLESMQIDPETGRYIAEMTQEEQDSFWQKVIGKPLLEFVQSVDL